MLAITLIILPLLFQIIAGRKAIGETISLKFGTICFISLITQIVSSIALYCISLYDFNKYIENHPSELRCGMGFAGLFVLIMFFTFVLLITIIIQYYVKKSYE